MSVTTTSSRANAESSTTAAARAVGVSKTYGAGDAAVHALDNVSATLQAGQFTAIMGPSGSGKSTLLHVLAGLDRPTSGEVYVGDTEISGMTDKQLTLLRRGKKGFFFPSLQPLPPPTPPGKKLLPVEKSRRTPQ